MKIEKLKAIKNDFYEGCGPSEIITLGFWVDNDAYILGTFYFGPGKNSNHEKIIDNHAENCDRLEQFIDYVVEKVRKYE